MKATYQKPTTDIVLIGMQGIICGSLGNGDNPNPFDTTDAPITDETSGNLSRRRNVWDDEEEEEF